MLYLGATIGSIKTCARDYWWSVGAHKTVGSIGTVVMNLLVIGCGREDIGTLLQTV